jgi:protein-tyrosine phosphatase
MLSFFKKTTKAHFDLASMGVDIHAHLIPGIDDGAKTTAESLALIRGLQDLGIEKIIATPHVYKEYYPNTKADILRGLDKLKMALKTANISIPIEAAAEYFLDDHFENLLAKNEILPLNGKYILVEMSFYGAPMKLYDYLFQIRQKGYIPILAHPERYIFYKDNFSEYEKLKDAGCLFQMNLLSLTGYYNETAKNIAQRLLSDYLIDFLGTDMHHLRHLNAIRNMELPSKVVSALENYPFKNRAFLNTGAVFKVG